MIGNRLKALLLLPVALLLMAATPLVDPAPIPVPAGLDAKAIATSIRLGGAQRGWLVTRQDPGAMELTLNIRTHMAKVGVKYDTQSIQLTYLESTNLDYEEKKGNRYIHRNYPKWVNNLVNDITVQLALAQSKAEVG
jgi:hypothetical protein